jgi:hypothetical protein
MARKARRTRRSPGGRWTPQRKRKGPARRLRYENHHGEDHRPGTRAKTPRASAWCRGASSSMAEARSEYSSRDGFRYGMGAAGRGSLATSGRVGFFSQTAPRQRAAGEKLPTNCNRSYDRGSRRAGFVDGLPRITARKTWSSMRDPAVVERAIEKRTRPPDAADVKRHRRGSLVPDHAGGHARPAHLMGSVFVVHRGKIEAESAPTGKAARVARQDSRRRVRIGLQ